MADCTRHIFLIAAVAASAAAGNAMATLKKVEENEANAQAAGCKYDTTKVDKASYPKHLPTQSRANCLSDTPTKRTDEGVSAT